MGIIVPSSTSCSIWIAKLYLGWIQTLVLCIQRFVEGKQLNTKFDHFRLISAVTMMRPCIGEWTGLYFLKRVTAASLRQSTMVPVLRCNAHFQREVSGRSAHSNSKGLPQPSSMGAMVKFKHLPVWNIPVKNRIWLKNKYNLTTLPATEHSIILSDCGRREKACLGG